MTSARPLSDLLVLDLSTTLPGAQATQFLADGGADVIQIEPPGGSPLRRNAGWPFFARGKRSIELDPHDTADLAVRDGLLARADVLVTTGRPRTLERLGLTAEELERVNPRLISALITGWGSSGPWAGLKGYEGLVMAKLGMFHTKRLMVSRPGPAFISVPFASWGAAQTAVQGILAALLERESSGRGQQIEADLVRGVSMLDTWQWNAELIAVRWPGAYETVDAYTPEGEPQGHMLFPLLVAPTKDGVWLQFAQVEPRLFLGMLEEFGLSWMLTDPEWEGIPRFEDQARKSRLWEIMLAKVGERTLAEWEEAFARNPNLSAEVFRHGSGILDHPQLAHDGRVVVVDDPDLGPVRQPSTLVHADGEPLTEARPAPRLNADADAIRALASTEPRLVADVARDDLPLSGVTIMELGLMFAAPFGATMLTDLGARVIKIESLTGDTIRHVLPFPESGGVRVMQGKESICLDLSTEDGRRIVHEIAKRSDVVLQSFRAGAAARAGVDAATLRALNPGLVYVNAPGYGTDGPYGPKPAYAPSIGAATGIALTDVPSAAASTATMADIKDGSRRLNQAGAVPSLQADGISALGVASTILVGLLARKRGRALGELTATMIGTVGHALAERAIDYPNRPAGPSADDDITGFCALYRMYRAAEGWVFLAVPEPDEWPELVRALGPELGDARFATADGRREHDAALADTLAAVFATRPAADWERELTAADLGCVQVHEGNPELQLQTDEALAAEYAAEATSPIFDKCLRMGTATRFSRSRTQTPGGCLAGDQTDALLGELGYDEQSIADLRERNIVG